MSSVKVAIRVRPFNRREITAQSVCILSVNENSVAIEKPNSSEKSKVFQFDHSYWSVDKTKDSICSDQQKIYEDLGLDVLTHALQGYNVCLFAYGQTGSGKSYTMMGNLGVSGEEGLIPRLCRDLFTKLQQPSIQNNGLIERIQSLVEVSYIEIYCERVRDLLNPDFKKGYLRVREHPILGPYVEDLSKCVVLSLDDINELIDSGNKARTVASTNMNETSSRSHAVFTMIVTQKFEDKQGGLITEKISKISLVDLAGSERADSTGATDKRLKEGCNINKSLTTLGKVIAALADMNTKRKKKSDFIPYRDSVLTWLLKENLGGNSKTTMIATLSPADLNYEETLSTLRYADRAKHIMCKAVINEDPNISLIRELKAEVIRLKQILKSEGIDVSNFNTPNECLRSENDKYYSTIDALRSSEKFIEELNETMEYKLKKAEKLRLQREIELTEMGIAIRQDGRVQGVYSSKKNPHLVNLNEDPAISECLIYYLKDGKTIIGRSDVKDSVDICLNGQFILDQHCTFVYENDKVIFEPFQNAECYINGSLINKPTELNSSDRVILGKSHVFRFNYPAQVLEKKSVQNDLTVSTTESIDWNYAILELLDIQGVDLRKEMEERLWKLEEQYRKERIETDRMFNEQLKEYEDLIQTLQEQVERQSLASSMIQDESMSISKDVSTDGNNTTETESDARIRWTEETYELASWAFRKWHRYRFNSIRDELWENNGYLKEANAISSELNKQIQFQQILVSTNSFIRDIQINRFTDARKPRSKQSGWVNDSSDCADKQIVIKMINTKNNSIQYLDLNSFKKRLLQMRMAYESSTAFSRTFDSEFNKRLTNSIHGDNDKSSASSSSASSSSSSASDDDDKDDGRRCAEKLNLLRRDPFYDGFEYFQKVGRAFVYLFCLNNNEDDKQESGTTLTTGLPLVGRVSLLQLGNNETLHQGQLYFMIRKKKVENQTENQQLGMNRKTDCGLDSTTKTKTTKTKKTTTTDDIQLDQLIQQLELANFDSSLIHGLCNKQMNEKTSTINLQFSDAQFGFFESQTAAAYSSWKDRRGRFLKDNTLTMDPTTPTLDLESNSARIEFEFGILCVKNLNSNYDELFCEFRFLHNNDVYSTPVVKEPYLNENGVNFNLLYTQNFSAQITSNFIDYIKNYPIEIDVYGHIKQSDVPNESSTYSNETSADNAQTRDAINLRSQLRTPETELKPIPNLSNGVGHRYDILAWFEVLELNQSGIYTPVSVEHLNGTICESVFIIQQGIQRRLAITLVYEMYNNPCNHSRSNQFHSPPKNLIFGVSELVIGRVRDTPEWLDSDEHTKILSLNLLPSKRYSETGDSRFEAAWDTSLHCSALLNRVTLPNQRIYMTISSYIKVKDCPSPVCLTKDISMVVYPRGFKQTVPRSLRSIWNVFYPEAVHEKRITAVYDLQMKKIMNEKNDMGVITKRYLNYYVRGEEIIKGWRPRGDSLIIEHQHDLERLEKILMVEECRQYLEAARFKKFAENDQSSNAEKSVCDLPESEKQSLMHDCVQILSSFVSNSKYPYNRSRSETRSTVDQQMDSNEVTNTISTSNFSSIDKTSSKNDPTDNCLSQSELTRSAISDNSDVCRPKCSVNIDGNEIAEDKDDNAQWVGVCDEVRISPVISRKGYLLVLDEYTGGWTRKWAVVRRPFLYFYNHEQDTIERNIINLTTSQIEYDMNTAFLLESDYLTEENSEKSALNNTNPTTTSITSSGNNSIVVVQKPTPRESQSNNNMRSSGYGTTGADRNSIQLISICKLNMFTLITPNRAILIQTDSEIGSDIHEWLYALNPLKAGEIRSMIGRNRRVKQMDCKSSLT